MRETQQESPVEQPNPNQIDDLLSQSARLCEGLLGKAECVEGDAMFPIQMNGQLTTIRFKGSPSAGSRFRELETEVRNASRVLLRAQDCSEGDVAVAYAALRRVYDDICECLYRAPYGERNLADDIQFHREGYVL